MVASSREAKRLRRRRELADRADERSIDEHFGHAWRDFKAHAPGVRLGLLHADRRRGLRVRRRRIRRGWIRTLRVRWIRTLRVRRWIRGGRIARITGRGIAVAVRRVRIRIAVWIRIS